MMEVVSGEISCGLLYYTDLVKRECKILVNLGRGHNMDNAIEPFWRCILDGTGHITLTGRKMTGERIENTVYSEGIDLSSITRKGELIIAEFLVRYRCEMSQKVEKVSLFNGSQVVYVAPLGYSLEAGEMLVLTLQNKVKPDSLDRKSKYILAKYLV